MPYALRAFGAPVWYGGGGGGSVSSPVGVDATSSHYAGRSPVPVVFPAFLPPSSWYAVSGVLLGDQPTICTAPVPQGNSVKAGSIFVLLFQSPSAQTQGTLANGTTLSLTFLLYGGSIVTGQVQVTSTLTGNVFQVICTVLQDIPLSPSL